MTAAEFALTVTTRTMSARAWWRLFGRMGRAAYDDTAVADEVRRAIDLQANPSLCGPDDTIIIALTNDAARYVDERMAP